MNLNLGRRRSPTLVGLDIQPGYVAAVQARVNGSIEVQHAAGMPLPGDIVREGEVLDAAVLANTLREFFDRAGLDRRVRLGVANQRTVLRMLELPPVTDRKELAAAVRFQAADQVPMPLNNAAIDFHSLGVVETPGGPRQRVVLVATQRDMVERLLAAVREAGLRPDGVDLSAFALIRALYRPNTAEDGDRVLYLNVGGLTNMAIAEATTCQFTRVVSGGLEAMAVEVAERRQMSLDQARELLRSTSLTAAPTPLPAQIVTEPSPQASEPASVSSPESASEPADQEDSEAGEQSGLGRPEAGTSWEEELRAQEEAEGHQEPIEPVLDDSERSGAGSHTAPTKRHDDLSDVRLVLENGVREIAGEVRNSLDYHRTQDGGGRVSKVVLSGAALEIDGFAEALQSDLGIEVLAQTVGILNHDAVAGVSPQRLAIAAGLAAEEVPA